MLRCDSGDEQVEAAPEIRSRRTPILVTVSILPVARAALRETDGRRSEKIFEIIRLRMLPLWASAVPTLYRQL